MYNCESVVNVTIILNMKYSNVSLEFGHWKCEKCQLITLVKISKSEICLMRMFCIIYKEGSKINVSIIILKRKIF